MALTRKFLSALGIEADKVDEIINAHTEVTDALKAERDGYKAKADKLVGVQKELDDLKAAAEKDGKDPFKVKYEAIKEEFETFKKDVSAKETKATKTAAYRELLKSAGVAEKRIDAVLKVSDIDGVELDKDGKINGADELLKSIKSEWADFIPTESAKGAKTATPPAGSNGGTMTREEIYKKDDHGRFVLDASQRQAALAKTLEAEQKG